MVRYWNRLALALAAAGALMLGMTFILFGTAEKTAAAGDFYTVVITPSGFNPPLCVLRREDTVRWENRTNQVRRIVVPSDDQDINPPLFDSGEIPPGGVSGKTLFPLVLTNKTYYDANQRSLKGLLATTLQSASCVELPPTPTPTNTPTATPIRPTATPTPDLRPAACYRVKMDGCALVPNLSKDQP